MKKAFKRNEKKKRMIASAAFFFFFSKRELNGKERRYNLPGLNFWVLL